MCKQGKRAETNRDTQATRRDIRSIQATRVATDSSDDEYLFIVANKAIIQPIAAKIGNVPVELIADSGASVNLLDNATFRRLNKRNAIQPKSPSLRLFAYGSTIPLSVQGSFTGEIRYGYDKAMDTFLVVTDETSASLMGRPTAMALGLFSEHEAINQISTITETVGRANTQKSSVVSES